MIRITNTVSLNESEVRFSFCRASGPGGQHVNKTDSAARLEFWIDQSSLPTYIKNRLKRMNDRRISDFGQITIEAKEFRSQHMNKQAALDRLVELIRQATITQKNRRPTKPTKGSQQRRIQSKKQRGDVKQMRRKPEE